MKNSIAKPASTDAVINLFSLIQSAIDKQGLSNTEFAKLVGTNGGIHPSMPGRHFKGITTPGCDVFLEELIAAGFKIEISHKYYDKLKWNSEQDYKKHLNFTKNEVTQSKD